LVKGPYLTKEAKLINNVEKKQLVYGDVLVVGIDIAKKVHWARVLGPMGVDVIMPFKFHNTREGFIRLESKINKPFAMRPFFRLTNKKNEEKLL